MSNVKTVNGLAYASVKRVDGLLHAPPTLLTDSFNRTDSTTTLGSTDGAGTLDPQAWVPNGTSVFGISSNQAYTPAGTGTKRNPITTVDAGTGDVDVRVKLATTGNQAALVFRYIDTNNHWYLLNWTTAGHLWLILRNTPAIDTTMLDLTAAGKPLYSNNDIMRVVTSGSLISIYGGVAGTTLLGTVTDSTHQTATRHGLYTNNETVANNGGDIAVRFDNFQIGAAPSGWYVGQIGLSA